MRILVTGARDWDDDKMLEQALWDHISGPESKVVVVHGNAPGADTMAQKWADYFGYATEPHPADWKTKHRAAGPIRNQEMVDAGADVCLAFLKAGSKGTRDCILRAQKAGIPVKIFPYDKDAAHEAEILSMPEAKQA